MDKYVIRKKDGNFAIMTPQQTQKNCLTFVQYWTNVVDVGPTLYKCYTNVLCLLDRQPMCEGSTWPSQLRSVFYIFIQIHLMLLFTHASIMLMVQHITSIG